MSAFGGVINIDEPVNKRGVKIRGDLFVLSGALRISLCQIAFLLCGLQQLQCFGHYCRPALRRVVGGVTVNKIQNAEIKRHGDFFGSIA